jgi:hypothetical protein
MTVKFIQCLLVAVVLSTAPYFLLPLFSISLNAEVAVAIGILVGGVGTPLIANLFNRNNGLEHNTDEDGELTTLYVGNLPYRANEDAVKAYFQEYTHVQSVRLMKDKRTGKRKGYGFVEVISSDVSKAINKLNDSVFQDRTLKVRYAKEKTAQ